MYHLNGVGLASFQEYVYPDVPIDINGDKTFLLLVLNSLYRIN